MNYQRQRLGLILGALIVIALILLILAVMGDRGPGPDPTATATIALTPKPTIVETPTLIAVTPALTVSPLSP